MLVQKLLSIAQVSGQAVLYILLALSVVSIGIILERWVYFARRKIDAAAVGRKVVDYLRDGDVDGARTYLKTLPGVEADVVRDALGWYGDGPDAVAEVLAGGTKERRKGYESGLLFLGTLGNNAPFIGLFGTVLGIVTRVPRARRSGGPTNAHGQRHERHRRGARRHRGRHPRRAPRGRRLQRVPEEVRRTSRRTTLSDLATWSWPR